MSKVDKLFYNDLTMPEVKEIVAEQRVPLLPVGSVEAHGPHCPLQTDCVGPIEICRLAAERVEHTAVVMPPVYYAYEEVNTNFPGTISITEPSLIGYVADILFSLALHGFSKIIVINGHGGNVPFLNLAMRRLNVEKYPDSVACTMNWWDLIPQEDYKRIGESEPGGMSHGGEFETSIVLHAIPELVQMDKAVKELGAHDYRSEGQTGMFVTGGGTTIGPAMYVGWMGGKGGQETGVMGDATLATAEKGREWLNIAADNLADFIRKWKDMAVNPVVDHH